jgi:hypothetical protein
MSASLKEAITIVIEASHKTFPIFHMSSYLVNVMCISHQSPKMIWERKPTDAAIHIYCNMLKEKKYRTEYQKIYEHFLDPLYEFIFYTPSPCMTNKEIVFIMWIGDWCLIEHGTYIRVYGAIKSLHLLPQFVLYKLLLQEVVFIRQRNLVESPIFLSSKSVSADTN